jgi:hypothetical protein
LREHVLERLPEGERRILEFLIGHCPHAVDRPQTDAATNYQRSAATPICSGSARASWWRLATVRSRPRITSSIKPPVCQNHRSPMDAQHDHGGALQPEPEEHGLVAHLAKLRRKIVPVPGGPAKIATYCLPPTSKVIGGAEKADSTLTFHTSSSVVSS